MTYQQRQLLRFEPSYEGDPRESPQRQNYDPRFSNTSPRPNYQQYPTNQRPPPPQQQQQQYQYQYPSDDRIYNRTRPKHGDVRGFEPDKYQPKKFDYQEDGRFHRQANERRHQQQHQQHHQQERMHEQQHNDLVRRYDEHGHYQEYEQSGHQGHPQEPHEQRVHQRHPQQQYEPRGHHGFDYGLPNHPQHHHDQHHRDGTYDIVQPAGRANNYSTKITDLLTSIKEPRHKDDSMLKAMEENKGYLAMMRFNHRDMPEVINNIQKSVGTLDAHHGYVIGFAWPNDIEVLTLSNPTVAERKWWDPNERASRFGVCCFWFKDMEQASRWFDGTPCIRQMNHPNNGLFQVIATPLTYSRNWEALAFGRDQQPVTLLWSEFPDIKEQKQEEFKNNYSTPAQECMKRFGANPYLSISEFKAGSEPIPYKFGQPEYSHLDVKKERVARAINTGWLAPKTFISVSSFPSIESVYHFFTSEPFQNIRSILSWYTDPVFVAIRLQKVKGTTRH